MNNFKITKTILENINEQNDRINECVDIVNGYTTDEETRVNQEIQRQENELRREEQYNNNENRFNEINTQLETKINYYNSISQMKSANLKVGNCVSTIGYYRENDGGGANYIIVQEGVLDNGYVHKLNNGLYAQMLINDRKCNVKQFGAKGDGVADDTQAIKNVLNCKAVYDVLFPVGDYKITEPLDLNGFKKIHGVSYNNLWDNYKESTTRLLYYPQTNNTSCITLNGAHVSFSNIVIQNMVWGKNTTGLAVRSIRSFIEKIKIYDFENIGLVLGGMYCQYDSIEVTCTNDFVKWVNADKANRICYALCRCDDWYVVNEGYKATDAMVQNLVLGSPTWGIHKYGLIVKGINHKFTDLFIPCPAEIPVIFGYEDGDKINESAYNCEINHIYMEENRFSGYDNNFVFGKYTRGCTISNGYLSGKLKVKDDGLKNSYKTNTALNLLSLYDNFNNSTNYANFYFINDNGTVKITDGITGDGGLYNNLFRALSVDSSTAKLVSKNKISVDANVKFNVGGRIKNSYESVKILEGKTVCFGCKYELSDDCDVNARALMPRDRTQEENGLGMNGIAQCYTKIPQGFFKDHDYLWIQFVELSNENLGTKGQVYLSNFFLYVVEENVSPYNNNVQNTGDIMNGELIVKDKLILTNSDGKMYRLSLDSSGNIVTKRCHNVILSSGVGYLIEALSSIIVDNGQPFTFKVRVYEGYSTDNLTVPGATKNDDGTYYRNITADNTVIYATGVTKI